MRAPRSLPASRPAPLTLPPSELLVRLTEPCTCTPTMSPSLSAARMPACSNALPGEFRVTLAPVSDTCRTTASAPKRANKAALMSERLINRFSMVWPLPSKVAA